MNILCSNDDGILAPGLALLSDICREVGEVTNGIGWVITKGNRKGLSPRARPNCVG